MAHHHWLAHDGRTATAPVSQHAHHQDVLERDELRPVLGDEHVLGTPALVRGVLLERGLVAHYFEEIEAHPVGPGHRQDRATIALLSAQAGLVQPFPGFVGAASSVTGAPRVVAPRGLSAFSSSGQAKMNWLGSAALAAPQASAKGLSRTFSCLSPYLHRGLHHPSQLRLLIAE